MKDALHLIGEERPNKQVPLLISMLDEHASFDAVAGVLTEINAELRFD